MICFSHQVSSALQTVLRDEITADSVVFPTPDDLQGSSSLLSETTIFVGSPVTTLTEPLIESMPRLQWIHSISAGVNTVPLDLLMKRGIQLSNSRGVHGKPIAEQILGIMISFSRALHRHWKNGAKHHWEPHYPLDELSGKTLLIVGAGSIGRELARKAKAFDMQVLGVRARAELLPHFDKMISLHELDETLPLADAVVLLLPLTNLTHHLMDTRRIGLMKATAILINYGRGALIDEEALVQALEDHQIGGAGLDVFENEPLITSSKLWSLDNVLITPHTGGWTPHYNERVVDIFLANWRSYQEFGSLVTGVDLRAGY